VAPFEAKGDQPMWQAVYDHAAGLNPGDMIGWDRLTAILGYDPSVPGASRSPILTASKHLLENHDRTLISVRGKGYRVTKAEEHEGIARGNQRSARRKIRNAVSVTTHVDRNQLTTAQQQSLDTLAHVLAQQNSMLKRHDQKLEHHDQQITQQDARFDVLEATLRKHGIPIPENRTVDGETV
jgi:hypothetical protein